MKRLFAALTLCLLSQTGYAQSTAPLNFSIPAPDELGAIPLYAGVAPGSQAASQVELWDSIDGLRSVRNVVRPTLTPVLPDPSNATGAAVIVAPGGAFRKLSIDNEGYDAAKWFANHGIAAFVLKYRVIETPADYHAYVVTLGAIMSRQNGAPSVLSTPSFAEQDGQAAIALVRRRAAEWNIDPHRVGFVGFSAGAMLTLSMGLLTDASQRPDFIAPIYGPMQAVTVPVDAPPLFAALAADDPLFGGGDTGLIQSWLAAKRKAELHMFFRGGHGFGMRTTQGSTVGHWIDELYWWMDANGFLRRN